jgi:hypothetical protein
MRLDRARHAVLGPAGLAAAGVVFSHWIANRFAAHQANRHQQLLATTGHRYWSWAVALAAGAFMLGLTAGAVRVLSRRQAALPRNARTYTSIAVGLMAWQSAGFLVLESTERWLVGNHLHVSHLLAEPAVVWGLVVQVPLSA